MKTFTARVTCTFDWPIMEMEDGWRLPPPPPCFELDDLTGAEISWDHSGGMQIMYPFGAFGLKSTRKHLNAWRKR